MTLRSSRFISYALVLVVALGSIASGRTAAAYTPESPEVKAMLAKGVKFMESSWQTDTSYYPRLGGMCIVALAVLKNGAPANHPLIVAAVQKCQKTCAERVPWNHDTDNYSLGIALIFLCELDPERYRTEISTLMAALVNRQQPGGGWSYADYKTGDTSQTQYAVLAMWIAHRSEIDVPRESVERVCNWVIRTQAPNGSWGYQGNDPGGNGARMEQTRTTPTMAAAALACLYICSEVFGFITPTTAGAPELPPAVREVIAVKPGETKPAVSTVALERAINEGGRWFSANMPVQTDSQQFYYMYSLERYQAFRELADNKFEKEPGWYNSGVQYLMKSQRADGSWANGEQGPVIDTAFAVLFLLRSAKKAIVKKVLEQGALIGGKGLPKDLSTAQVTSTGKVVDPQFSGKVEDVLKLLEDPANPQSDLMNLPDELKLETDPAKRVAQIARLRRLAVAGPYQARLTAVKTLGRVRDLDNVPPLIYALSDPDPRIISAARDALRFISRKIDGYGPPDAPSQQQWQEAQRKWSAWYKSIRPDGELLE